MIRRFSKAKILESLQPKLTLFKIPELLVFECKEYSPRSKEFIEQIMEQFNGRPLIIRSSASDEDNDNKSLAGEYESVLNVSSLSEFEICNAIETVIESYTQKGGFRRGTDEVIVQEMVLKPSMSGVVFTHDLNTGAPYYVINYDDVTGLTDTVTSGGGEYANRTLYIHRSVLSSLRSKRFPRLIKAIQELEEVLSSQFLDIEFALDADFTPYLLQVRSITTQPNWNRAVSKRIDAALTGIQSFVQDRMKPMARVYGVTTVLGQMPDWNPAEMIGRVPRALAFSLYKTLITDHAWRIAREKMGYAVPDGQPLMVSLAGQPFIDTRLSFHSFLPIELSAEISQKLVNGWVQRLREYPEYHDKIEFDVAITTFSFDIDSKMERLVGDILSLAEKAEFRESLRKQTQSLLADSVDSGISDALAKIEILTTKQANMDCLSCEHDISELFGLIDDCIHYGTIPFSILARHGFIAKTILMSLNRHGVLTMEDINQIQSGIRTVASDLVRDMHQLQIGKLSRPEFMVRYGHLRPGTYDILSQRYDQMTELGNEDSIFCAEEEHASFELSIIQKQQINDLLQREGFLEFNAEKLLNYIQAATVGREYGKFVFTRSVSNMLELIANFGEKNSLSREEMSHISVGDILDIITKSSEGTMEESLRKISMEEAEYHVLSVAVRLPQVLFDEAGVHVVPFQVSHPNFITHSNVTAVCIYLGAGDELPPILAGKIVLIENADPGFDWIFSQQISGLITKYGGANSHMAIRCAEFGIPAAIGCGEQRFELLRQSNQLSLDCAAGLINPLH